MITPPNITRLPLGTTKINSGTITFQSLHTNPRQCIMCHSITFYSYTDDAWLYVTVSLDDPKPPGSILIFFLDIKASMSQNLFSLNKTRQKYLSKAQRQKLPLC